MKKLLLCLPICCMLLGCAYSNPAVSSGASINVAQPHAVVSPPPATRKKVALVAHDALKPALLAWVEANAVLLTDQELFCTGTTGRLVAAILEKKLPGKAFRLTRFHSGPLGGDQQMGALIAENGIDILIFFIDPMSAHPHDADIRALMRLSQVRNIVLATTPATADYVIASPLFQKAYTPKRLEYSSYESRTLNTVR